MTDMRVCCPHCGEHIRATLVLSPADYKKPGPPTYNPGTEVDEFVIKAIDEFRCSFSSLASLLEEKEVPTSKGGKRWYPATARTLYLNALDRKKDRTDTVSRGKHTIR